MPIFDSIGNDNNSDLCGISCCSHGPAENDIENDAQECDKVCNPFLYCYSCSGFVTVTLIAVNTPNVVGQEVNEYYLPSKISHRYFSIWHPPKV